MKALIVILTNIYFLVPTLSLACGAHKEGGKISYKELRKFYQKKKRSVSSDDLADFAKGHRTPSWEAKLGNLLLSHRSSATNRIVLSLPVNLPKGNRAPFGDGQLNARMEFAKWDQEGFPVIGIQKTQNNRSTREYRFHESLKVTKHTEMALNDGWYEVKTEGATENANGRYFFNFQTSALPVSEFINGIPIELRTFANGRVAPNLARISKTDAFHDLNEFDLGQGFNTHSPWLADNVHGRFPDNDEGARITALGGVKTWGTATEAWQRPANGPWKYLYTCFDPRNRVDEKRKGVPSGAGWHFVGDAAETVLNTLSTVEIPFAIGRTHGKPNPTGGFTETITAMWVKPDEAQVTRRGEFHWYAIPYDHHVCTEIWVHPCVPSLGNNWGFKNDCGFQ